MGRELGEALRTRLCPLRPFAAFAATPALGVSLLHPTSLNRAQFPHALRVRIAVTDVGPSAHRDNRVAVGAVELHVVLCDRRVEACTLIARV